MNNKFTNKHDTVNFYNLLKSTNGGDLITVAEFLKIQGNIKINNKNYTTEFIEKIIIDTIFKLQNNIYFKKPSIAKKIISFIFCCSFLNSKQEKTSRQEEKYNPAIISEILNEVEKLIKESKKINKIPSIISESKKLREIIKQYSKESNKKDNIRLIESKNKSYEIYRIDESKIDSSRRNKSPNFN